MDLLARREHSRLELERKLEARGLESGAVAQALDELECDGLLDDGRFAESFVAARARKGQGPVRIRAELRERGVDEADTARGLAEAGADWNEIAARARSKRFGRSCTGGLRGPCSAGEVPAVSRFRARPDPRGTG